MSLRPLVVSDSSALCSFLFSCIQLNDIGLKSKFWSRPQARKKVKKCCLVFVKETNFETRTNHKTQLFFQLFLDKILMKDSFQSFERTFQMFVNRSGSVISFVEEKILKTQRSEVNFTNVIWTTFLFKSQTSSFFLLAF